MSPSLASMTTPDADNVVMPFVLVINNNIKYRPFFMEYGIDSSVDILIYWRELQRFFSAMNPFQLFGPTHKKVDNHELLVPNSSSINEWKKMLLRIQLKMSLAVVIHCTSLQDYNRF